MRMLRILAVIAAVAVSARAAAVQAAAKNSVQEDCGPCLKYRLLSMVDSVFSRAEEGISLAEGVSLVKSPGGGGAPRSLSKQEAEKTDIEDLLADRVKRFVSTHTLKMDLRGSDIVDAASSAGRAIGGAVDFFSDLTGEHEEGEGGDEVESARKKVKKAGKMLLPLLMMIKMKVAMMAKLAFAAIALIAGKALLIGKIALLLSGIIAIKKLLSSQHKSVTYEIVPHHDHHEHHHEGWASSGGGGGGGGDIGGGHHGWGRSGDSLAYRGYQPQQPAAAAATSQ